MVDVCCNVYLHEHVCTILYVLWGGALCVTKHTPHVGSPYVWELSKYGRCMRKIVCTRGTSLGEREDTAQPPQDTQEQPDYNSTLFQDSQDPNNDSSTDLNQWLTRDYL
ncbi:hypothetical protein L484_000887 [Morus notabilis]|uniref:Uncharacterized protein n=1 Tax=Morus notabilis TaxID=981085 RepID=W9QWF6_9ROSA|nr:hypothetical protein L484_000887 [Morus notabilis]